MSIYDYKMKQQDGTEVSMEKYRGQVLLIVNTATGCGFTPQYTELQENSTFQGFGNSPMSLLIRPVAQKMDPDYKNNSKIKWNFTKFLIDQDGNLVERFEPTQGMKVVREKIQEVMK